MTADSEAFVRQEAALFDLLFDAALRAQFADNRQAALARYRLSPAALRDFDAIRLDALLLDARMRSDMVLAGFSKALPLTFCLLSSCPGGLDRLRSLLDSRVMRTAPTDRTVVFAGRVRELLPSLGLGDALPAATAITDLEHSMAWTAATRKRTALADGEPDLPARALHPDWQQRPLQLAPYVNAGLLPDSHRALLAAWCPCDNATLWRTLNRQPLTAGQREAGLRQGTPRLLVARANVSVMSRIDPVVEHQTLELSDGFAALLPHVDGQRSTQDLLDGLAAAGAPAGMLAGVETGFRQLLETGMLIQ